MTDESWCGPSNWSKKLNFTQYNFLVEAYQHSIPNAVSDWLCYSLSILLYIVSSLGVCDCLDFQSVCEEDYYNLDKVLNDISVLKQLHYSLTISMHDSL